MKKLVFFILCLFELSSLCAMNNRPGQQVTGQFLLGLSRLTAAAERARQDRASAERAQRIAGAKNEAKERVNALDIDSSRKHFFIAQIDALSDEYAFGACAIAEHAEECVMNNDWSAVERAIDRAAGAEADAAR